jgi:hypothetical protein
MADVISFATRKVIEPEPPVEGGTTMFGGRIYTWVRNDFGVAVSDEGTYAFTLEPAFPVENLAAWMGVLTAFRLAWQIGHVKGFECAMMWKDGPQELMPETRPDPSGVSVSKLVEAVNTENKPTV